MDWTLAINLNRAALLRLMTTLFAAVGVSLDGAVTMVSRQIRNRMLRELRPSESSARRLIAIEAQRVEAEGYTVPEDKPRSAPDKPIPRGNGSGTRGRSFNLFDARLRPGQRGARYARGAGPSIRSFDDPVPAFQPPPVAPSPDDQVSIESLMRRYASMEYALNHISAQARRLLRAKARYARRSSPKRFGAMRPGRPPGHRARATHEVDAVLRECHRLALWIERPPDKPRLS